MNALSNKMSDIEHGNCYDFWVTSGDENITMCICLILSISLLGGGIFLMYHLSGSII
jgi:hypothetical protein